MFLENTAVDQTTYEAHGRGRDRGRGRGRRRTRNFIPLQRSLHVFSEINNPEGRHTSEQVDTLLASSEINEQRSDSTLAKVSVNISYENVSNEQRSNSTPAEISVDISCENVSNEQRLDSIPAEASVDISRENMLYESTDIVTQDISLLNSSKMFSLNKKIESNVKIIIKNITCYKNVYLKQ